MRRRSRHTFIVSVLLVASACGGTPAATLVTPSPGSTGSTAVPSVPAGQSPDGSAPIVSIAAPADGSTAGAGDLIIRADVTGVRLVDRIGATPVPGEAHLIYYVGVDFVPIRAGEPAYTAPGTYAASSEGSHTWPGLAPGRYAIAVQVVNNDDTPLSPPVTARATVTLS
jgi:hypothetical protein